MDASTAAALKPGQIVMVPYGRKSERRTATVISAGRLTTWGHGLRPAGTAPSTPLCVVKVDLGGRVGARSFGNELVGAVDA